MEQNFKMFSMLFMSMLLAGCASTFGDRDTASRQPAYRQQQAELQQPQNLESQRTYQTNQMETITGRVTEAGGLISENGMPYRLNGAKAAPLRDYANQKVTVHGYKSVFQGHRAIVVQSFNAEGRGTKFGRASQPNRQSEVDTGAPNNNKSNSDTGNKGQ